MPSIKTIIMIVVAVAFAFSTYKAYSIGSDLATKAAQLEKTEKSLKDSQDANKALKDQLSKFELDKARMVALDAQHTKELQNARDQINSLRNDIAAGRVRLEIRDGLCTPSAKSETTNTGVGVAGTCRLGSAAEQDYITLVDEMNYQREQLLFLLGIVNPKN